LFMGNESKKFISHPREGLREKVCQRGSQGNPRALIGGETNRKRTGKTRSTKTIRGRKKKREVIVGWQF